MPLCHIVEVTFVEEKMITDLTKLDVVGVKFGPAHEFRLCDSLPKVSDECEKDRP